MYLLCCIFLWVIVVKNPSAGSHLSFLNYLIFLNPSKLHPKCIFVSKTALNNLLFQLSWESHFAKRLEKYPIARAHAWNCNRTKRLLLWVSTAGWLFLPAFWEIRQYFKHLIYLVRDRQVSHNLFRTNLIIDTGRDLTNSLKWRGMKLTQWEYQWRERNKNRMLPIFMCLTSLIMVW